MGDDPGGGMPTKLGQIQMPIRMSEIGEAELGDCASDYRTRPGGKHESGPTTETLADHGDLCRVD